jgi:hypothetical protein
MSAKIIELAQFRQVARAKSGIAFPQVYSVDGSYWDEEKDGSLKLGDRWAPPLYTLSKEDDGGYCDPQWESISTVEDGLLIVRHHRREEFAEGYLDAVIDAQTGRGTISQTVYRTKEGLFTLQHRNPVPGGLTNLLIYVTKMPDVELSGDWIDIWHIIHEDGAVTDDIDPVLYPHEE